MWLSAAPSLANDTQTGTQNQSSSANGSNAPDSTLTDAAAGLRNLGNSLNELQVDIQQQYDDHMATIRLLEKQLSDKDIDEQKAQQLIHELKENNKKNKAKLQQLQNNNKIIKDNSKTIKDNLEALKYERKLAKWIPLGYALIAVVATGDSKTDKVVNGFAAYGAGSLLEHSGYGLAGRITVWKFR